MTDLRAGPVGTAASDRLPGADGPFELRPSTRETVSDLLSPLPAAFAEEYSDEELEADLATFELDRIFAACEDGRSVGCGGAYGFRMQVPGGSVGAAGVTLIGVLPTHRRRGILRSIMRRLLDQARERGEAVAILWASEGSIYQRFGYGLATLAAAIDADVPRIAFVRPEPREGTIRLVDQAEAERLFPPVYERAMAGVPGVLDRSAAWWHGNTMRDVPVVKAELGIRFLAIYEVHGAAEGYAIYRVKADFGERGPNSTANVRELVAATPRAERELWEFVLGTDLVAHVKAVRQPVPPPLLSLVTEPRRLGITIGDAIWLRIVDLRGAIAGRTYAAAASVVVDVADAFCPWNAGLWRFRLRPEPGESSAERIEPNDGSAPTPAEVALDVADLGAVYLGGFRLADLARVGRVRELRPGAIARLDRALLTDVVPWCATIF